MPKMNDEILTDIKERESAINEKGGFGKIILSYHGESDFIDVTHEVTTRHYAEEPKAGKIARQFYVRKG